MASLNSKVRRLEQKVAAMPGAQMHIDLCYQWLMRDYVEEHPGIELVEAGDTSPETYAKIQYDRAVARGDGKAAKRWNDECERLHPPRELQSMDEMVAEMEKEMQEINNSRVTGVPTQEQEAVDAAIRAACKRLGIDRPTRVNAEY